MRSHHHHHNHQRAHHHHHRHAHHHHPSAHHTINTTSNTSPARCSNRLESSQPTLIDRPQAGRCSSAWPVSRCAALPDGSRCTHRAAPGELYLQFTEKRRDDHRSKVATEVHDMDMRSVRRRECRRGPKLYNILVLASGRGRGGMGDGGSAMAIRGAPRAVACSRKQRRRWLVAGTEVSESRPRLQPPTPRAQFAEPWGQKPQPSPGTEAGGRARAAGSVNRSRGSSFACNKRRREQPCEKPLAEESGIAHAPGHYGAFLQRCGARASPRAAEPSHKGRQRRRADRGHARGGGQGGLAGPPLTAPHWGTAGLCACSMCHSGEGAHHGSRGSVQGARAAQGGRAQAEAGDTGIRRRARPRSHCQCASLRTGSSGSSSRQARDAIATGNPAAAREVKVVSRTPERRWLIDAYFGLLWAAGAFATAETLFTVTTLADAILSGTTLAVASRPHYRDLELPVACRPPYRGFKLPVARRSLYREFWLRRPALDTALLHPCAGCRADVMVSVWQSHDREKGKVFAGVADRAKLGLKRVCQDHRSSSALCRHFKCLRHGCFSALCKIGGLQCLCRSAVQRCATTGVVFATDAF